MLWYMQTSDTLAVSVSLKPSPDITHKLSKYLVPQQQVSTDWAQHMKAAAMIAALACRAWAIGSLIQNLGNKKDVHELGNPQADQITAVHAAEQVMRF